MNVYVEDVERACRLYRDLFGFVETFRTPAQGPPVHVLLRLGQLTLGLADVGATRTTHGLTVGGGPPRAEIAVWTDGVARAFAEVTAAGARPLSPPHDVLASLRAAWVADPDGNPVQLVARRGDRG